MDLIFSLDFLGADIKCHSNASLTLKNHSESEISVDWLQRAKETCDYNLKNILTFKVSTHIISLTLRLNSYNCAYRFQINQYAFIRLGYVQLLHPQQGAWWWRTPVILTHPALLPLQPESALPRPQLSLEMWFGPACLPYTPRLPVCFSPALHTSITPFFCFLIPAQFCSFLLLQHLNNFPITVHFDSFFTLSRSDSDLPNTSTPPLSLTLFPHLYKLVWCTVRVYIWCKVITYLVHNPKTEKLNNMQTVVLRQ